MAVYWSKQFAYNFFALNANFYDLILDPLGLRRPAQAGVKEKYLLKNGYFTAVNLSSVKTVADRHRHAAYHNKH